jgi:predicted MFS family arabinose efflux permease
VFNLSVVRAHPDQPGRATGITQSGTYVGATSGPLLFGLIAEQWSYQAAWVVATIITTGACLAVLNARRALARSLSRSVAQGVTQGSPLARQNEEEPV